MIKDLPSKRGKYHIHASHRHAGSIELDAVFIPASAHWLIDGRECGFAGNITPERNGDEYEIDAVELIEEQ